MTSYEFNINDKFLRITNSTKFSTLAGEMVSKYVQYLYASATPPINLKVGLSILYNNIDDAKQGHKIERNKYDIFAILFQRDFDELCYTQYNPSNKKHKLDYIKTMNETAMRLFASYAPTIIEPVYEPTV